MVWRDFSHGSSLIACCNRFGCWPLHGHVRDGSSPACRQKAGFDEKNHHPSDRDVDGVCDVFFPGTVSPLPYDIIAFFTGTLLSIPLILSSKFEVKGNEIYLKRSRAFIAILLFLVVIRSGIKLWIGDSISAMQSAGLFFILAFGMILTWRIAMLIKYRQLAKN